ncbi:(deoxy)nucleoside triphosphate pyrophosphohydrolase [Microbacterium oxydans]|uniref:(deoxy)nucleoside triphosphate pyrophosphohydrolase n=1 Tax=Microbacterium oxydans TaxID=82380 RepID=UPI0009E60B0C|nr:(deoxy)nucleoside triphosphate pyrophosphohydrolase [Microbacterium oxydans]
MSESRVIEVVAAVIEHDGKILACRRRLEKAAGGKWEFPGGKLEKGETNSEALVREIQEELSTSIEVIAPLRTDETRVGESTIRLICLRARLLGEPPTQSLDHDELRWVTHSDLPDLDWAAPDLPAVAELAAGDLNR